MLIKERNRKIKQVLSKEFGYQNVKVKGERGTATGWVNIYIKAKKPHKGECPRPEGWNGYYYECEECRRKREKVKNKVLEILKKSGLYDELYSYYDDMNYKHKECIITVELDENMEEKVKQNKVIIENDSYKVIKSGSWTWLYFPSKPDEKIREKIKQLGFRFSKKRIAWYLTQPIDENQLQEVLNA